MVYKFIDIVFIIVVLSGIIVSKLIPHMHYLLPFWDIAFFILMPIAMMSAMKKIMDQFKTTRELQDV